MFKVQSLKPKVQGLKFGGYLQEAGNCYKAEEAVLKVNTLFCNCHDFI